MRGGGVTTAAKHLSSHLGQKWHRACLLLCSYGCTCLSLALVRLINLLPQGAWHKRATVRRREWNNNNNSTQRLEVIQPSIGGFYYSLTVRGLYHTEDH